MGEKPNCLRGAAGYSMLEVMIGGLLLGLIALALLPAFLSLSNSLKVNAFQTECNAIVRAKLQEYVNGVGTLTQSQGGTPTTSISSGFEYTKSRFYRYNDPSQPPISETTPLGVTYSYCQGTPLKGYPGYREKINRNDVIAHDAGDDPVNPDVPDRLQGFQLYVNIRHYNPRYTAALGENHPRRQCPTGTTYTTPYNYQFYRLGDALEVIVTGMIRTNPARANGGRGGALWGPYKDVDDDTPNPRLVCSATQIIYPPQRPFRYFLGSDGKVRNFQATIAFHDGAPNSSREAMEAHFRSIWSQSPGIASGSPGSISSPVLSNIRSLAVSPENNTVYVLRPGELTLYKNCSDKSVYVDALSFDQTPDCTLGSSNVSVWSLDSNIENITADFQDLRSSETSDDRVYAMFNSGGNNTGDIRQLDLTSATDAVAIAPTLTGVNFKLPVDHPRIRGIFMAQSFPSVDTPNMFFFDNTCPANASGSLNTYCVGIFNTADPLMSMPVREMPVQVEGISY